MLLDWIYLIMAGLTEIVFAICLKASQGFTRPLPTTLFVVSAVLSLYLMNKSMNSISLGTVYAVWTGIGAAGVVITGAILFKDPLSLPRIVFISLLLISIIGLKFSE
ncbi:Quaternary ammonium compound-resistance protein sugE [Rickettsiales bacterium Ac37b]|nr:Quaternary ammonium compound-resistance protein sugE [Rickettsiales bacterium Ac37b]